MCDHFSGDTGIQGYKQREAAAAARGNLDTGSAPSENHRDREGHHVEDHSVHFVEPGEDVFNDGSSANLESSDLSSSTLQWINPVVLVPRKSSTSTCFKAIRWLQHAMRTSL
jgi:hypothetical protein